jgi:hypothetical protein
MNFPRPKHRHIAPPPRRKAQAPAPVPRLSDHPEPSLNGTFAALVGIALTAVCMRGEIPSSLAREAAIGVLLSLGLSIVGDLRLGGVRNLVRADLMAILAFYFLTLFEFLFPQPNFNTKTSLATAHEAVLCVLLAFAGLVIGRHLLHPKKQPFTHTLTREIPTAWIIDDLLDRAFSRLPLHAYSGRISIVNEMVEWWMEPRFSQPWQRGRYGRLEGTARRIGHA